MDINRREFAQGLMVMALSPMAAVAGEMSGSEGDRIQALLADWVDGRHQCRGVSAAAIEQDRIRFRSHGVMGVKDKREISQDTVFGIASLTKVFTGLLPPTRTSQGSCACGSRAAISSDEHEGAKLPRA